jgi:secernin
MCDTLVALGNATRDGAVILAKNSDRAPNEAQYPIYVPRIRHSEAMVRCTHIQIPQVTETFAVLLSRPFWMWGCEMGVNEFGVAIGNEAVFTKEPRAKTGLLGMDLMRLALERAETARRALDVIVELLKEHGQGGSCDIYHPGFSYHNSFILADPGQAWVLETAGRYWAAKQVRDVYSISNGLTIGTDWDLASPGLVEHAIEKRWCKSEADFDFARCYSDFFYTRVSACRPRQRRTGKRLEATQGQITVKSMFAELRDHGAQDAAASWVPDGGGITVCMHAANNLTRRSQSTASLVAHLRKDLPVYWMTGTSAPCTGVFKPFYMGPVPAMVGEPKGTYDAKTLWWSHERFHRIVLADYAVRMRAYREEREELEAAFVAEEEDLCKQYRAASHDQREEILAGFSSHCLERAAAATQIWMDRFPAVPVQRRPSVFYQRYWKKQNEMAGLAPSYSA